MTSGPATLEVRARCPIRVPQVFYEQGLAPGPDADVETRAEGAQQWANPRDLWEDPTLDPGSQEVLGGIGLAAEYYSIREFTKDLVKAEHQLAFIVQALGQSGTQKDYSDLIAGRPAYFPWDWPEGFRSGRFYQIKFLENGAYGLHNDRWTFKKDELHWIPERVYEDSLAKADETTGQPRVATLVGEIREGASFDDEWPS